MMKKKTNLKIAHIVSLPRVGGLELAYSEFINQRFESVAVEHHTILTREFVVPFLKDYIQQGSKSIHTLPSYKSKKIIRWLPGLRDYKRKRFFKKIMPDILVIWSKPNIRYILSIKDYVRTVYYEHGASWFEKKESKMKEFLKSVSGIICNSFAAKRMLELKWDIERSTRIEVCLNAVRPDCVPSSYQTKKMPQDRPFRLGTAGRLSPHKGLPLVIHALLELRKRGFPCELSVAGTGKELEKLRLLSRELEVEKNVEFLGFVDDMSAFFSRIDCFVCPSLREPFGLVCAEAMAHGCPVIATKVDGLPEVVQDLETGFCIAPSLSLEEYTKFGGDLNGLPEYVYNPVTDRLEDPKILDPHSIADAVETLYSDPNMYERMSYSANQIALDKFDYNDHAAQILETLMRFHSG